MNLNSDKLIQNRLHIFLYHSAKLLFVQLFFPLGHLPADRLVSLLFLLHQYLYIALYTLLSGQCFCAKFRVGAMVFKIRSISDTGYRAVGKHLFYNSARCAEVRFVSTLWACWVRSSRPRSPVFSQLAMRVDRSQFCAQR